MVISFLNVVRILNETHITEEGGFYSKQALAFTALWNYVISM